MHEDSSQDYNLSRVGIYRNLRIIKDSQRNSTISEPYFEEETNLFNQAISKACQISAKAERDGEVLSFSDFDYDGSDHEICSPFGSDDPFINLNTFDVASELANFRAKVIITSIQRPNGTRAFIKFLKTGFE
ncbi:hypothetical protein Ciccas_002282 [Cichlidogyrus casuarinus]|uniref:Uncharacterized protein n=1 Tax=Cichlidogyrus casuarinus TaxID=1844966 RepID=A0ABD2QHX1_9PLAT